MSARDRHGGERLVGRVQPAERFERGVVQRLHAERDAVDAGRAIAAKALGLDAGRIGLERDLGIGATVQCRAIASRIAADRRGLHQRGRAAAEEDAGRPCGPARAAADGASSAAKAAHEARLVDRRVAHMAVEVAIGAFRQAERPMHIDAEAAIALPTVDPDRQRRSRQRLREFQEAPRAVRKPAAAGGRPCFSSLSSRRRCGRWPSGRNIGS